MSDSLIERVAKAIYASNRYFKYDRPLDEQTGADNWIPIEWEDLGQDDRDIATMAARAAIEATPLEALAGFAREIIRLSWEDAVDAFDVQDAALRHGLIKNGVIEDDGSERLVFTPALSEGE